MKIIDRFEAEQYPVSLFVNGGFFQYGMRWDDYEKKLHKDVNREKIQLIRDFILNEKIKESQYKVVNILFDDNTVGNFTYRAWGDLLAATWAEAENQDYNYLLFGW